MNSVWGLIIAGFTLLLDQWSKNLVLKKIIYGTSLPILPVFDLTLVFNKGISFGFLSQHSALGVYLLIGLTVGITSFMLYWLYKSQTRLASTGLGLIIGGAMGNIIDRIRMGAVVDFLDFHWGTYAFPAFNIADAAITVGALCVVTNDILFKKKS